MGKGREGEKKGRLETRGLGKGKWLKENRRPTTDGELFKQF
jgi:hypothetical protein